MFTNLNDILEENVYIYMYILNNFKGHYIYIYMFISLLTSLHHNHNYC